MALASLGLLRILSFAALPLLAACATGGESDSAHAPHAAMAQPRDAREAVRFPRALREHTLANMRDQAGTNMHEAASRFAIEAANAGATGDVKPALAALGHLTAQCVACHAAFEFENDAAHASPESR